MGWAWLLLACRGVGELRGSNLPSAPVAKWGREILGQLIFEAPAEKIRRQPFVLESPP